NAVTMELMLDASRYPRPADVENFWKQAISRLENIPGVTAAGAGTSLPFGGNHDRADITIEGEPLPKPGEFPHPDLHTISPSYPKALGLSLIAGRVFDERDAAEAAPVVLVNSLLARRFWGAAANAGGQRIMPGDSFL